MSACSQQTLCRIYNHTDRHTARKCQRFHRCDHPQCQMIWMEWEGQTGMCRWSTSTFENSGGCTALDMPEWRETTEQIDWREQQPSQRACFSEVLKCWGSWDTTCVYKAKDITSSIARRKKAWKEEALDDLLWKDERGPSSIRRTLEPFQRQCWGTFWETGRSAYGFFRAHRYHLEQNWIDLTNNYRLLEIITWLYLIKMWNALASLVLKVAYSFGLSIAGIQIGENFISGMGIYSGWTRDAAPSKLACPPGNRPTFAQISPVSCWVNYTFCSVSHWLILLLLCDLRCQIVLRWS